MRVPQTVIKRPLLTEKGNRLRETGGSASAPAEGEEYSQKLLFEVAKDANKIEIKNAVQSLFDVRVEGVRTAVYRGKWRRMGRSEGRRASFKKAIVKLAEGDAIDVYEGI